LLKVGGGSHAFYRFADVKPPFLSSSSLTHARRENNIPYTNNAQGVCQESQAELPTASTAGSEAPNGTVTARMCSVESRGWANRGGEQMELREGQFLMNVMVQGWTWCSACPPQHQDGHFLEFTFTVTVPAGYKISENNKTQRAANVPVRISLGTNDSFILISSKVSK